MRILVIDSDIEVLKMIRDTLAADHELYVVRTLGEVEAAREFDIVIANCFNPLCPFEHIEEYCQLTDVLLVAMSADSVPIYQRQLNMPFDSPDLWRVLDLISSGQSKFVVDTIETKFLKDYQKFRAS